MTSRKGAVSQPAHSSPSPVSYVRSAAVRAGASVLAVTCVAAIGAATQGAFFHNFYDDGISPSAGTFVLHGLLPYRDFWFLYGPLVGYVMAIPNLLFGTSLDINRALGVMLLGLQGAAGFVLLRRIAPSGLAATFAVGSVVVPLRGVAVDPTAWMLAMLPATAALAIATRRDERPTAAVLTGVLLGISFLMRLDLGAYATAACLLVAMRRRHLVVTWLCVVVPVVAALAATVPWPSLYEQVIWYPIVGPRIYRPFTPTPLDPGLGFQAFLDALLLAVLPRIGLGLAVIRTVIDRDRSRLLLASITFALFCQLQTLGRGDTYHFAQAATPALLAIGAAVASLRGASLVQRGSGAALAAVIGLVSGLGLYWFAGPADPYRSQIEQASAFVRAATTREEPIFVGLTENRFTFENPLVVYFLADRSPGSRLTMFNPGVTNTDAGQSTIIDDLERTGTRYLVLDRLHALEHEREGLGSIPGSTILDLYISSHFVVERDYGLVAVMVRTGP
jgi:hypothetical protein